MIKEMHPWEKGTAVDRMVYNEDKTDADKTLKEKAERYKNSAEKVVAGEKLSTLARGFLTGCGSMDKVTSEKCRQFVVDHGKIVRKVFDTVPDDDVPAAVYALVKAVSEDK